MLRIALLFSSGMLLLGLSAAPAWSQESPPRDPSQGWENGSPGGSGQPAPGPRPPRADRDDADGPPGPPQVGSDPNDRDPNGRPPMPGRDPLHLGPRGRDGNGPPPEGPDGPRPDGPEGDRRQPPGMPGPPMDMESLKTRDPELYKAMQEDRDLERQTRDQAEQYRHASKDDQGKIKDKLAEIVGKHFAVRQQLRMIEVKRLEQQVKQLRERIEQREKSRKEIVSKRVIELTGTDDDEHF